MTVARNPEGWIKAWTVLAGYVPAGLVLALLLPDAVVANSWIPFDTRLSRSFAAASADPVRVRLYWAWILLLAPPALIAFSMVAPIKLDKVAAADKEGSILMSIIGFLVFGYIATPWWVYTLFNLEVESVRSGSRLGRVVMSMSGSRIGLFCGGTLLTTGTLLTAWLSCVAIPIGYVRVLRLHRNRHEQASDQRNEGN